jgi:acetyl-CoA acyltransferase
LLAQTIKELLKRKNGLDLNLIDDVIMGNANGSGEDNRNVARMSSLLAGIPPTVPGVTVNRLCASGAEALVQASRAIQVGDAKLIIAGGVESMSRAPWIVKRTDKKAPEKVEISELQQSTVGWRMTNPLFPSQWTQSLGRCAEEVAERYKISREAQDQWAVRSHQRANAAWNNNLHSDFTFELNGLNRDESIRPESSLESLAELKSAFSEGGAGTAGNSSPINDGALASFVTDANLAKLLGLEITCEIIGVQTAGVEPNEFTRGPVFAIKKLMQKLDLKFSDIKVWEINEAFSAMVLTVLHEIPEIKEDLVNVNGGAIAIGHPLGASGARAVIDTGRELKRIGGGIGIAAACIGVGQGIAVAVRV